MKKTLEIFKPGKHATLDGRTINFSEEDVKASVTAYDPALHEAPIVVGHPRTDAPAYGWVKGLEFAEGKMTAEPDQVDANFAEMVNAGRFKKISASFYLPDAPGNPKPGVYYLRHVGFLGAQPPSVKGLKSASFSETEEGIIEFGDYDDVINASMWRRLREWIIGKFGIEEADKVVPDYNVGTLEDAARTEAPVETQSAFAETHPHPNPLPEGEGIEKEKEEQMKEKELKEKEDALNQKEAAFAEREANLKRKEVEARHSEHVSFAEGLIKEGKLLPVHKDRVVGILDFADGLENGVVEFGEGDGKTGQPVSQVFREFLTGQPKIVEFGEVAEGEGEPSDSASFAAAPGFTVDTAALEIHQKALSYQAKNPGTEYMAAVKAVS